MDLVIGVLTAVLGLAFIAAPWALSLTGHSLAAATMVAGGVIVALQGVALVRRAPRGWRTRPGRR